MRSLLVLLLFVLVGISLTAKASNMPKGYEAEIIGRVYTACSRNVIDLVEERTSFYREANGIQGSYDYFYITFFKARIENEIINIKLEYSIFEGDDIYYDLLEDDNKSCKL